MSEHAHDDPVRPLDEQTVREWLKDAEARRQRPASEDRIEDIRARLDREIPRSARNTRSRR